MYFVAVSLRTWLFYRDERTLESGLTLLLLWGLLFFSEPLFSRRWQAYFPVYLFIQTTQVFLLISLPGSPDFIAALLAMLSMQVMLRLPTRIWAAWVGVCALVIGLLFARTYQYQAIALALIYTAGNVFFGSFTHTIRKAQATRQRNQVLATELEQANRQLQDYSTQLERLSAARERNRLARELHDSVTQTIFSMNLTSQSATLLLERNPSRVGEQLERLYSLTRNAMGELQVLINELKPDPTGQEGLSAALLGLLADSRFSNLNVTVEVNGDELLGPIEQQGLYRIAQEALNNIVKHAHTDQALIRLCLRQPMWMEITDHGHGFELTQAQQGDKLGLVSMAERAAEIGWSFKITSSPGSGTRIRVEKSQPEEVEDGHS